MGNWHVIVVEGREGDLRAFVAGYLGDRGAEPTRVVFGDDVRLQRESLHERLRALLRGGYHAIVVPDELVGSLQDALSRAGSGVGLRMVDRHPVATGSFTFATEVYSRDVSAQIRAIVEPLPLGVRLTQHSESEDERTDATGVELYAPVHDYVYRTRGTLEGPVDGILEIRRRLGEIEALQLEPLQLA
jgi:hypothetical protein